MAGRQHKILTEQSQGTLDGIVSALRMSRVFPEHFWTAIHKIQRHMGIRTYCIIGFEHLPPNNGLTANSVVIYLKRVYGNNGGHVINCNAFSTRLRFVGMPHRDWVPV